LETKNSLSSLTLNLFRVPSLLASLILDVRSFG
jgi:hypothetical protein